MATYSETLVSKQESHLRPFDARQDLGPVADLVELCFSDTLDPDGREYLGRMRAAAHNSSWLSWAAQAEWSAPAMGGYVWKQDGRLIGNVSLIPYFVKGRRFFLIANVAVHPDYRRQGIARKLTQQAIQFVRQRGAPSVWLHVREENTPAVRLYLDLGFIERARRTSWITFPGALEIVNRPAGHTASVIASPSDLTAAALPGVLLPGERIFRPPARGWDQMRLWLERDYPPELSWHMPLKISALNPGLVGEIYRLLYGSPVRQWALLDGNRLLCSAAWQPMAGHAAALWLAAPPDANPRHVHTLLTAARKDISPSQPLNLDYPARRHENAIRAAGFTPTQTLIWMELPFSRR